MGILQQLKVKAKARAAAVRHGSPAQKMRVILVVGQDGAIGTIAYLAAILRTSGKKVGVITQQYIEIGADRAVGSDQADVSGDPYRLQALLAQMKKVGCTFALVEVPSDLPAHQFVGITPAMVVVRRCGDDHADQVTAQTRLAMLNTVLARNPKNVVYNRDDPSSNELAHLMGRDGVISFGTHQKAECRITEVQLHPKGSALKLTIDHQTELFLVTRLAGKQTVYNAAAAAAAAYILHAPIPAIEDGIAELSEVPAHMQYVPIQRPYQLVLDAAMTPGGLAETLETLRHFTQNRLIVVSAAALGVQPAWRTRLGEIASRHSDRLVITDGEYTPDQSPNQVREELLQGVLAAGGEAKTDEVADREAAIEKAVSIARRGDVIVIAGVTARPYRQLGTQRMPWSDYKIVAELFGLE